MQEALRQYVREGRKSGQCVDPRMGASEVVEKIDKVVQFIERCIAIEIDPEPSGFLRWFLRPLLVVRIGIAKSFLMDNLSQANLKILVLLSSYYLTGKGWFFAHFNFVYAKKCAEQGKLMAETSDGNNAMRPLVAIIYGNLALACFEEIRNASDSFDTEIVEDKKLWEPIRENAAKAGKNMARISQSAFDDHMPALVNNYCKLGFLLRDHSPYEIEREMGSRLIKTATDILK